VTIEAGSEEPVLSVPVSAVLDNGSRRIVLVEKGEGRFEPREIELGARGDGFVEVKRGLVKGESVVTSANFLIDSESNLNAALRNFTPPSEKSAQDTGMKP
jgi:Cu(I)/Ag(I) efflux system membrane fusion protein